MLINGLILILSIAIYASFGIQNLIYILFSTLTTYFAAKSMNNKNKKLIFILTILTNASILIFFKLFSYGKTNLGAFNEISILAPLGISYYTLQVMSYLIDVYKEKYKPEKNFLNYMLYVIYIPYLFIGPINRYDQIKETLFAKRKIQANNVLNGSIRILWGLFKKLVIAGRVSILINTITTEEYQGAYALFAMLMYSIQLYSDFSGGIDIVIGVSNILGIKLKENFDSPYLSEDLKEFWRRWHISLSSWLRDYIYIPLGGNRKGKIRTKINLIVTFVVSGLWHGINYFLWGLLHGILVSCYSIFKTKWKIVNRIITYILVSLLWCFFIWTDTIQALKMLESIFTTFNYGDFINNLMQMGLNIQNMIILIISTMMLFIFDYKKTNIIEKIKNLSLNWKIIIIGLFILTILVFGIYGIGFNVSEFIYSKF